ncbi:MAG: GHKL domain-containing protein [Flavobacteriales bacterium]|nr:MAG: GHKL domain-containing protein [Flavobacteriales bacterium]|tara:strand:- start:11049 stop:12488 length:1440 start_codon:yes stop_codon:yes gene_type:complete
MRLLSLRARIFTALIFLMVVASLLIAGVTIFQYREQSNTYHEQRLERKENQLKKRIAYLLNDTVLAVTPENAAAIFEPHMQQTSDVLNINFRIYSLSGVLQSSTQLMEAAPVQVLPDILLNQLQSRTSERLIDVSTTNGIRMRSSYFYAFDANGLPLAILNVPYYDDDSLSSLELNAFLLRLVQVYVIMLIIAIILAFIVSSYITQSLETISIKLNQTKLAKSNSKIELTKASKEISALVEAYNHMVDELEQSAIKLAKSQREIAWREMAKQVAHEIKNPLTPMRLSIQHFEQQVAKGTSEWKTQVHEFSQTLIQQIDTMSAIASAFSQFAAMPTGQSELLNVTETVKRALELYKDAPIALDADTAYYAQLDATQLVRIINNLMSNAIDACAEVSKPFIEVRIFGDKKWIYVSVEDNGKGVSDSLQERIFEPTFTTKTSGMGLGLSMVKSIVETFGGTIQFESIPNVKTRFQVRFPRID